MKASLFILFFIFNAIFITYIDALCQNEPDGAFIADPSSRSRFFFCQGGQAISGSCEPGFEFDPFDRLCDQVTPPNANPCFNLRDGTFLPDPSDRRRFIYCSGGQGISGQCDFGFEFDPIDNVCDRATSTPRTTTPITPRDPCFNRPDNTFVADPSNRQRYFWCFGGQGTAGYCPEGHFFRDLTCEPDVVQTTTVRTTRPTPPLPTTPTRVPIPTQPTRQPLPTRTVATTRGPAIPTRSGIQTTRTTSRGPPLLPTRTTPARTG